jgi:hypothetical protein
MTVRSCRYCRITNVSPKNAKNCTKLDTLPAVSGRFRKVLGSRADERYERDDGDRRVGRLDVLSRGVADADGTGSA